MMKRPTKTFAGLGLVATLTTALYWQATRPSAVSPAAVTSRASVGGPSPSVPITPPPAYVPPANPRFQALAAKGITNPYMQASYPYALDHPLSPLETDFFSLTKVHDFIAKYLPAARGGDAAAQLYLSRAQLLCMNWVEGAEDLKHRLAQRPPSQEPRQAWRRQYVQSALNELQTRCVGMESDEARLTKSALGWLTKAARGGDPQAQANWASQMLSLMNEVDVHGEKADAVRQQARDYLLRAVASGHPLVLASVAAGVKEGHEEDAEGRSVGGDPVEATAWAQLAAARGARDWTESWRNLGESELSPGQLEAAGRRARVLADQLARGDLEALRTPVLFQSYGLPEFDQTLSPENRTRLTTAFERLEAEARSGFAQAEGP